MITILLAMIVISFAWQPTDERKFTATVFGLAYGFHFLLSGHLNATQYFFSGALLDLTIIFILGTLAYNEMAHILQWICVYSITTNYLGWQLWDNSHSLIIYENIFLAIYAGSLLTLLVGGPDGWRTFKNRWSAPQLSSAFGRGPLQGLAVRRQEKEC